MSSVICNALREELSRVKQESFQLLTLKKDCLSRFLPLEMESPPYLILPALVLSGALRKYKSAPEHYQQLNKSFLERAIGMASIFQLVLLASEVHGRVSDEGPQAENGCHFSYYFPVLIGDYIYGKLLRRLCEIGCSQRVAQLASVICDMNAGGLKRKELLECGSSNDASTLAALKLEYGSLYLEAARVGIWLSGGDDRLEEDFGYIGFAVGMSLGAAELGLGEKLIKECQQEAWNYCGRISEGWLRDSAVNLLQYAGVKTNSLRTASGQ